MRAEPYLFLNGRCDEAIALYKSALGAEVQMLMRMKDSPDPHPPGMCPPGAENNVMHACMRIGESQMMLSDGMPGSKPEFKGFSVSLTVNDEADARKKFTALAEGGQIQMPLTKTFFSPCFGMVADKFGVSWLLVVDDKKQA